MIAHGRSAGRGPLVALLFHMVLTFVLGNVYAGDRYCIHEEEAEADSWLFLNARDRKGECQKFCV